MTFPRSPFRRCPTSCCHLVLMILAATSCLLCRTARASLVYFDSFETKPSNVSLHLSDDELGMTYYVVTGSGTPQTAAADGRMALDLSTLPPDRGLAFYGPVVPPNRWERFDFAGPDAWVTLVPQSRTNQETSTATLPTFAPAGTSASPWSIARAALGEGTVSPETVNLAALYPNWDPTKPYHLEIHWIASGANAILEARVWNGEIPPPYNSGAKVTYTLTSALWPGSPARAAVAGVAGMTGVASRVDAITEYDAAPAYPTLIPATAPGISYSGRWLTANTTERHATSAGQRFRFYATGDACYLHVKGTGYAPGNPPVSFRVDGGAWHRVLPPDPQENVIPVYEGAAWGPHAVEAIVSGAYAAVDQSSPSGRFILEGVSVSPGGSVAAMPYPARKVLFAGDSISCGFRILPEAVDTSRCGQFEARISAPTQVADRMGVDIANISFPGIGFCRGADSTGMPALGMLQNFAPGVPWAPDFEPDAIFINLGSNDGSTAAAPDDVLQAAVRDYLKAMRAMFPHPRIFLLRPFYGTREAILRAGFDAAADPNSAWVDTTGWLDLAQYHDTTDVVHPNLAGATKYAARVMALLSDYFANAGPIAVMSTPSSGASVYGTVPVSGTAEGFQFADYTLEFGSGDAPAVWLPIAREKQRVVNGALGAWDVSHLPAGHYTLRLTVEANGKEAAVQTPVNVVLPGDVNGDGAVTVGDAALALRIAAGLDPVASGRMPYVDISPKPGPSGLPYGEGLVNVNDALAIARLALMP